LALAFPVAGSIPALVMVTYPVGAASPTRAARLMVVPENCGVATLNTSGARRSPEQ
jgi:hypothetical protein